MSGPADYSPSATRRLGPEAPIEFALRRERKSPRVLMARQHNNTTGEHSETKSGVNGVAERPAFSFRRWGQRPHCSLRPAQQT